MGEILATLVLLKQIHQVTHMSRPFGYRQYTHLLLFFSSQTQQSILGTLKT